MATEDINPAEELDAAYDLLAEAYRERDSYKAGNTELLELLMQLHAGDHSKVLHRGRDILLGAGLLNQNLTLNWDALDARKPKRQTWAEAVHECVTDPQEIARLMALDDEVE